MPAKVSAVSLWVDEILSSSVLPVAGLVLAAALALLYAVGLVTEEFTAAMAILCRCQSFPALTQTKNAYLTIIGNFIHA